MEFEDIQTIAVLGAGNMGHGIAEVAALAGYDVNLRDINEELVQNGYEQIEWSLGKLVDNDRIGADEKEATIDRVTPVVPVEDAVGDADVIIEAVPEKMDIKKEVYREVEEHAPERTLFATNTSSLSITELSEVTDRPEKFCGMHFFNPPVRMQLVEIISGAHTDPGTLDAIEALAEDFGKTPIRVRKDSPGFIVNRVAVPLMNEVAWMVHDGEATIAEIDSTTKYEMGLPMGSFELADYVGIDISHDVLEYVNSELGKAYEPCPLLTEKVENENLGKKTGKGFYDYENGGVEIPPDQGREDIERHLLAMVANEVAKLVGGDVADPAEIDEAVMLGLGWPDGPAKLADDYGLDALVEDLDDAHEESGHPRYEAADALREAAEAGGFYGGDDEDDEGGHEFEAISVEYPGDMVGHVTLDRPHRMNSISPELMEELETAIDLLEADEEVRSILLTGAGDRAFSAGADVTAVTAGTGVEAIDLSRKGQETFGKLKECEMPVLAAIDGFCLGGGMELSMCADMRIATDRSEFGQTEHNLGLIPGWGGTQRLQRIVGEARAKEIIFTADRFEAETMYDYDFVNEVVDPDDFEERAHELAADLAGGPPIAQKLTKRAMLRGQDDVEAGLEIEAQAFGHLLETDDLMEGVSAFMEDREPEFEGK